MSRSHDLPRRSCHAVPASSPRFIERSQELAADMILLDLEDSVAPDKKVDASIAAAAAVRSGDWGEKVLCVRVNAWSTPWTAFDLLAVVSGAGVRLDSVMVPKVESAAQVVATDLVLRQAEIAASLPVGHVAIEIQIESAIGLAMVEQICGASERVASVSFGPADFAASLGMPTLQGGVPAGSAGHEFSYALSRIMVAGRAYGLQVLDGPYMDISDLRGLEDYARTVHLLGVDGKWTVHPDQIPVVNEVFTPAVDVFERACLIVEACERASASGLGAIRFEGEMIDEASRHMATRLMRRGERCGLSQRSSRSSPET